MAISATFYSMTKKQNSTKRPNSGGTSFNISLKEQTSVQTPRITIKTSGNPSVYNYCYIPTFSRYYWVTDWVYDAGIWSASLVVDVLGTYKTAIGSSTQYVTRAYSDYDPDIIDVYPRKAGGGTDHYAAFTGMYSSLSNMTFIIGVTSANSSKPAIGTTVYYAVSYSTVKGFIAHLVSMNYTTFADISDDLAKWICNPFQWIKSVIVLPISYSGLPAWTSASAIEFGADGNGSAFSYPCTCKIVSSTDAIELTCDISIPKHPDIDAQHSYYQSEPYSNYTLHFPPFGQIAIPSAALYGRTTLYCRTRVDPVTGGATLLVNRVASWGSDICIAEAQVGVSLPVDAAIVDFTANPTAMAASLIGGTANAVGTILSGGKLQGILESFVDGSLSSVSKMQTISNGGKLCDLGLNATLYLEYFRSVGQDPDNYGYPLGQRKQLNTLSGFILCDNAEIAINSATYDEMRNIENYLNTGFFYE